MSLFQCRDSCKIEVVVLDPGHFHASLLQKDALAVINDTIRIYAPEGIGVNQYLESIEFLQPSAKVSHHMEETSIYRRRLSPENAFRS